MQCLFELSKCLLYITVECDRLPFLCDEKNSITQKRMWQTHLMICSFNTSLMFFLLFILFFGNVLIMSAHDAHVNLVENLTFSVSSFFVCWELGGTVSATLNAVKKMELFFFFINHHFSPLQGWYLLFFFWVLWHFYFPLRTHFTLFEVSWWNSM